MYSSVNACRSSSSAYGHQERPGAASSFEEDHFLRDGPLPSTRTTSFDADRARAISETCSENSERFISAGPNAVLHLSLRPPKVYNSNRGSTRSRVSRLDRGAPATERPLKYFHSSLMASSCKHTISQKSAHKHTHARTLTHSVSCTHAHAHAHAHAPAHAHCAYLQPEVEV